MIGSGSTSVNCRLTFELFKYLYLDLRILTNPKAKENLSYLIKEVKFGYGDDSDSKAKIYD